MPGRRLLLLAEQSFGTMSSKTANAAIRYIPEQVVAVVDSARAGQSAQQVLGFGGDIPVVGTVEEGIGLSPTAVLVGVAPSGGRLPETWRDMIRKSIAAKLDVWSGLHSFLSDDTEFAGLAKDAGVSLIDLRKTPSDLPVSSGRTRDTSATIILAVGTDCNVGKMTAQLQIRDAMKRSGHRVGFAPTGQTGILVEGTGIAVDAVIADFIGGAAERVTLEAAENSDIVLVEGQGSIVHPGYSGVTLGLTHGSMPPGFYFIRVFSLFATTLSFNAILMWHIRTLLKVDGLQWNVRAWGRILHYQWVFPGAWRVCFPAWAAWLKPGFHPWQDDNRAHVATWKAENGEADKASAA